MTLSVGLVAVGLVVGVTALALALLALACVMLYYLRSQRRARAAMALRQAEQRTSAEVEARLAAIVESSQDAIISKSLDGVITTWNSGAERVFGYTAPEAVGQPIFFLIPPERRDEETRILARIRLGERVEPFETLRITKDGRPIEISVAVSPVRDADGRVVGASKIARDIGAQKRIERALWESEARITAIVNAAVEGILTIDAQGLIEFVNPAVLAIFGYSEAELLGHNVRMLMPEPFASAHDSYLVNYQRTGQRKIIGIGREVEGRRKDGSIFPVDLSVGEIAPDGSGGIRRYAGIVRDITARKRAEALLVAKEAAEAANRAKDDFLAAVSHDLRTPIASIMLLSDLMRRKNPTDEQRRKIDQIQECAKTQSRLIEDILDATRILHGKLKVDKRPVALVSVVRAAVEAVGPIAREHGVEILVDESDPGGSGIPVLGDGLRLQQICWNLVINAVKFSPRGGDVRVRVGEDASGVWLQVTDRGKGIEPEFLPHVFDRLSQAAGPSSDRQSGLGLGLSIVRHIAELHGGSVRATSDGPGHGATFTVLLPRLASRIGA